MSSIELMLFHIV